MVLTGGLKVCSRKAYGKKQRIIGHIGKIVMTFFAGGFQLFLLVILSFKKHWQYCHLKNIGNIVI
jgi:hypothetical protein